MMIYLATDNGLVVCEDDLQVRGRGLEGQHVSSVTAREGVILAGTRDGIFRSDDAGSTWREASAGLNHRHVRWVAHHPHQADLAFAGTEPAGIFVSTDGAASWREAPEVSRLRDQHHWFLPYSREAGCVRGFAFQDGRAYAAVEVGGLLRSDDTGASWGLVEGSSGSPNMNEQPPAHIHPDVHSIAVHPSSPDLVFAPTGGGFYHASDGGKTWRCLYECYVRAVWVDPLDPAHLILGPADGVDRNGRIEETRDGGRSWQMASDGLPVPWRNHMVERFVQVEGQLLAVLSNGALMACTLDVLDWRPVLPEIEGVNALAADAYRNK